MISAELHSSERHRLSPSPLEKAVIIHFSVLLIFTSWAFGGQAPWVRQVIAVWGAVGVLLFIVAGLKQRKTANPSLHPAVRWLWPLLFFDAFVGVSGLNPSFVEITNAGETSLIMGHPLSWIPSSARPLLTWSELWEFNVIVLSCFNLTVVPRSRRVIRMILLIVAGNAVALAVFGTFQKLVGSGGLWFGLVPSPNPKFFSTFIYPNHWGAFTLLNTAVCLGLLFHFIRRGAQRNIWHTPVPMGALAILLLAVTIPLSASRSCTVLIAGLIGGAGLHSLRRLIRHRRQCGQSTTAPLTGLVIASCLALGAIYALGQDVIAQRAQVTSEQLAAIAKEDTLNSRLALYRDTWHMAAEKPWFGWGLETYAHVFRIFNTQRTAEVALWIPYYAEAHNDWLQSLAEVGFVGTGLLVLLISLPVFSIPWRRVSSSLPRYLLAGCGIILLYAWLEFPFANPAVMIVFWACLYSARNYAALENSPQSPAHPPSG